MSVTPLDRYPVRVVKDERANRTVVFANDGTLWRWTGWGWRQLPNPPGGRRIVDLVTGFPCGDAWRADDMSLWYLSSNDDAAEPWMPVPSMPQPQKESGA